MEASPMETSTGKAVSIGMWGRLGLFVGTLGQLFHAIRRGPFWWLLPFFIVLVFFAVLLVLVQVFPAAAPFVYAIF